MTDGGEKRPKKTWLERRRAARLREEQAERQRQLREKADAERLADAVDRVADARLAGELTRKFVDAGHCHVDRSAETEERRRVEAIIARDRGDEAKERMRAAAEIEVGDGKFANLSDTVVEPTPEWKEKGEFERFTPRAPDGTVRSVTTVRRVKTPIIVRMHKAGKLNDDLAATCLWYRNTYCTAGLEGHNSSSQWNPNSTIRRGAVDAGFGYVPTSEAVAEARDTYRAARDALPAFYLRFFEAIVLDDIPLRRAARFARCRDDKAQRRFRDVAEDLYRHCAKVKTDMPSVDED